MYFFLRILDGWESGEVEVAAALAALRLRKVSG